MYCKVIYIDLTQNLFNWLHPIYSTAIKYDWLSHGQEYGLQIEIDLVSNPYSWVILVMPFSLTYLNSQRSDNKVCCVNC